MSNAHSILATARGERTGHTQAPELIDDIRLESHEHVDHIGDVRHDMTLYTRNALMAGAGLLFFLVLITLYKAYRRSRGPPLPAVPLDYSQQRSMLKAARVNQAELSAANTAAS